ncbi:MAG: GTP 3',8-cyclase MoaA [Deltaproteobacteria bacterium]|nr:GTP 3',8-cyclase MoaA [Deltaproteobacteria bacterium]
MTGLSDSFQRPINYLRISVTDRCNLRCIYCMPAEGISRLPHNEVLDYEEILAVAQAAASLGINKLRLTGGEPLARAELTHLVQMLSRIEGIDDIALTTNGVLLREYAIPLKKAGLKRVNVSLDTLQRERFKRNARRDRLGDVIDGIAAAEEAGLEPVKLNMVVIRGINDDEVLDFARRTIEKGWHVRFIELMPFTSGASLQFIPTKEVKERLSSLGILEPIPSSQGNGPAKYYRFPGAKGTVGFISPLSEHFCFNCNRLRLTVDGKLRPCLLSDKEVDLKTPLRCGASLEELRVLIQQAVAAKPERHYLLEGMLPIVRSMCQVGG